MLAACAPSQLSPEALLDPLTCGQCHSRHLREWSGSMHAYASADPVFVAMNQRGQRETGGALGDFCVKCHAPMALREGLTTDGLNLEAVPAQFKGVTCFFCHTVDQVNGEHNAPLRLASDLAMRGALSNPIETPAHAALFSPLHDRDRLESSSLCGSCHDVQTGHGVDLERTFAEWRASVFAQPPLGATCGQCHMAQSRAEQPAANVPGAPLRRTHSHTFAAVDVALTEFPEKDAQREEVQSLLDGTLQSALCVARTPQGTQLRVVLDNIAAGHSFPSGSSQHRRLWVETQAFSDGGVIAFSGVVPADQDETSDPSSWLMRDCLFGPDGGSVEMFWEATRFDGNTLPAQATFDKLDPRFYQSHVMHTSPLPRLPERVTMKVWLRPMGRAVLRHLVESGDLDVSVLHAAPTFQLGQALEWTARSATHTFVDSAGNPVSCVSLTNLNVQAQTVPAQTRCSP